MMPVIRMTFFASKFAKLTFFAKKLGVSQKSGVHLAAFCAGPGKFFWLFLKILKRRLFLKEIALGGKVHTTPKVRGFFYFCDFNVLAQSKRVGK